MLKQFTENEIWIQIQQLFLCPAEFEKDLEMSDDEEGSTGQSDADKCFRKTVKRKEKEEAVEAAFDQFIHARALAKKKNELKAELDKKNADIRASIIDQDIALEDGEFFCHKCKVKFDKAYRYTHEFFHS